MAKYIRSFIPLLAFTPLIQAFLWAVLFVFFGIIPASIIFIVCYIIPIHRNRGDRNYLLKRFWKWIINKCIMEGLVKDFCIVDSKGARFYADICESKSDTPYIFAVAPHGLIPFGVYLLTENNPKAIIHAAIPLFFFNLTRSIFFAPRGGMAPVSKKEILKTLSLNQHAFVYPGGINEIKASRHERTKIFSQNNGLIKIAVQQKTPVIPIYIENESPTLKDMIPWLTKFTIKLTGYPILTAAPGTPQKLRAHIGEPIDTELNTVNEEESIHKIHALVYETFRLLVKEAEDDNVIQFV